MLREIRQQVKMGSLAAYREVLASPSRSSNYREYQGKVRRMMLLFNNSIRVLQMARDSQITLVRILTELLESKQ